MGIGTGEGRVQRFVPKNHGVVYALLWTGKAESLLGMPDFNRIISAIRYIASDGAMSIVCDDTPDEDESHVRPFKDYVVQTAQGKISVWSDDFVDREYEPIAEDTVYRTLRVAQAQRDIQG